MSEQQVVVLQKAVNLAGGQEALGRMIGTTGANIRAMFKRRSIPPKFIRPIERAVGIPAHELRPDMYTTADSQLPASDAALEGPLAEVYQIVGRICFSPHLKQRLDLFHEMKERLEALYGARTQDQQQA
jgi:DNA-binding transcriptional regulator YdaS (Cro superfamily)